MKNPASIRTTETATGLLASTLLLSARAFIAPVFLLSGLSKLGDPAATIAYIQSAGLPWATLGFLLAVVTEIAGGAALVLGYRTRSIAAVLAVFSVAAALAFHAEFGDQAQITQFLKNLAIAGGLLQITVCGPGRFSVDARSIAKDP